MGFGDATGKRQKFFLLLPNPVRGALVHFPKHLSIKLSDVVKNALSKGISCFAV